MNYNSCINALHRYMYHDLVTVTRQKGNTDDEGADDYGTQDIYKDIPCSLSQYKKGISITETDRQATITSDLRVCLDPQYEVLPNDILTVKHEGQIFVLNAAKPFIYPTHQEISARKESDA